MTRLWDRKVLGFSILRKPLLFLLPERLILSSLSITLRRVGLCSTNNWDRDPSKLLGELDAERQLSTAVGKLANLGRLGIWKSPVVYQWPKWKRVPSEWTAVQPEALNRIRRIETGRIT